MSIPSRRTTREAIAAALEARLVTSTPRYAEVVYADRPVDFGGQSPIVVVASAGTNRQPLTFQGTQPIFYITIVLMVLAASSSGVDDLLDDLEQQIAVFTEAYRTGPMWGAINYDARSRTEYVITTIDGVEYKTEEIPLIIHGKL